MSRSNTTRRSAILNALADKFKEIDGSGAFKARLDGNVETRMKFWDEIEQYPAVHMAAGAETREYWGGGNKWRFLTITIRAYVNAEDPIEELEELLEDIETVIDANNSLTYQQLGTDAGVSQFTVISIDTDEGVLAPLGIGEMILEARYEEKIMKFLGILILAVSLVTSQRLRHSCFSLGRWKNICYWHNRCCSNWYFSNS